MTGDTCSSIASANNIDTVRLLQLNQGFNCDKIKIGTSLCVNDGHFGCLNYYQVDPAIDKSCNDIQQSFHSRFTLSRRSMKTWTATMVWPI